MDIKSFIFLNFFCLLVLYINPFVEGDALYGLCANSQCSTPISKGITILRYSSPDDSRISVEPNEDVLIFVKEYGPKKDLWGVVVRGNKGYISKKFIRETTLLSKEVVPASFEFKTPVLVTDSYTVSSNLHVSSQSHQLNVVPQSVQHMHSSDYHLLSSIPNNVQQQDNFINSASQEQQLINSISSNLQQQQQIMNSAPNSFSQQQDYVNSAPSSFQGQQGLMNSAPNAVPQQHDFTNSVPINFQSQEASSNIHQAWNNPSESHVYNSPSGLNPSSIDLQHQSSQLSSHFQKHLEKVMNSLEMTDMQSQEILPSATHIAGVHSPDPAVTSLHENSFRNVPNSFGSENFNPNVPSPSQGFQNSHQPSFEHLQSIQSPYAQGIHPSLLSNDFVDDDYSRTLAMLSSMGFEGSDMYARQDEHDQSASQNTGRNLDFSTEEFNPVSSQLQQSIETSGTILHSSIDSTLHVKENKLINEIPGGTAIPENYNSVETIEAKLSAENTITDSNSGEENEESLSEVFNDDVFDGSEEDDNDEEDISPDDELISSVENTENIENQLNKQSASPSQENLQSSVGIPELQSSRTFSADSSNTLDDLSKEHSSTIQNKHVGTSHSEISSNMNTIPQETKSHVDGHSVLESSMTESIRKIDKTENFVQNSLDESVNINSKTINPVVSHTEIVQEKIVSIPNTFPEDLSKLDRNNNDALTTESSTYKKEHTTPKISDFLLENDKVEVEQIISPLLDIDSLGEDLTTYQGRNLKGEYGTTDDPNSDTEGSNDENITQSDSDSYSSYGNWFDALKSAIDAIISWIPEPLYSILMDLQKKGISPRVPVFTTICGFTCIFLIIPLFYLKDRSKEKELSALLAEAEKKAYTFSATTMVLEEKLENAKAEIADLKKSLVEEKSVTENLRVEFENQAEELDNAKAELESCLEVIDALKEKENEYLTLINDYEKEKEHYTEHKESLDKIMKEQESSIEDLTCQLQESENKVAELEKEKEQFLIVKTDYEDKLALFDRNCNQLLQEAEVWNMRVKELTETVNTEIAAKEELMASLKAKEEEIESLKEVVETFKIIEEIEDPEELAKTKEEKLQYLLNSVMISNQLKKEEEKSKILDEQLQQEKNKILDMEVELLEAKSEIDKLKLNYNQALQDKAEAQTKLEVLTNYFKDKEIQLQRQLGAQEADRQKKEENVNSAERRIMLIEQENASYKSQVASMKQEMEETERTLRSQIAAQEKKAHENWIAARAAERNLENMKQEVTQLRQRLTLLEREQENWANAPRDDIIRPVPKRIPGVNEESGSQETSERGMFPPPLHDRLPLPPMMLPPDRPLPPLPPPPMPPMFLPPPHHMDRHFRPQPWHMPPPEHSSDYRTTPPEFMAGRESTPPRGRPPILDGDTAPNTSSPMTTETRDSRNSTPPHLLPDFHDIPPQPGRPYFPPPVGRPRYPMHPPYRRDPGPEHKRLDNQNESNSRGPTQPPPPEQWQHSRV